MHHVFCLFHKPPIYIAASETNEKQQDKTTKVNNLSELLDKLSHPVIQSTYICGGLDDWMKSRENLKCVQMKIF